MNEVYVEPNNPVLNTVAEAIKSDDITSGEVQRVIDRMFELAYPEQGDRSKPVLVGLAGPQIGVSRRIILVDIAAEVGKGGGGNLVAYINPEIISSSEETVEGYEGCRSTGRVCGIVTRNAEVKVKAYTREGDIIEQDFSGFPAVIFQHEIDHLDGVRFVDKVIKDEDLHWVEKEEFPEYRKSWRNWPNKCSRSRWLEISAFEN